jgi:Holliday junction resolvase-like predicted endonuclease
MLKDRVHSAAVRYLNLSGHKVICSNHLDRFIVTEDEDGIAFVDVLYNTDGTSAEPYAIDRDVFEDAVYKFFEENDGPLDVPVRYDVVELLVINEGRALVKHAINVNV